MKPPPPRAAAKPSKKAAQLTTNALDHDLDEVAAEWGGRGERGRGGGRWRGEGEGGEQIEGDGNKNVARGRVGKGRGGRGRGGPVLLSTLSASIAAARQQEEVRGAPGGWEDQRPRVVDGGAEGNNVAQGGPARVEEGEEEQEELEIAEEVVRKKDVGRLGEGSGGEGGWGGLNSSISGAHMSVR